MYKIIRNILFLFDPEKVHYFTAASIRNILKIPGMKFIWTKLYTVEDKRLHKTLFGITFKNPVGLAAGFDKNATMYNDLAYCGFGFIEIGTVTPKGQPGNDKPRLFRLKEDQGIINRMGFNNDGVEIAVENLKNKKTNVIIGGNIGKNKVTPNENATDDYVYAFNQLFDYVDYFAVNVSSPNTSGLRNLQNKTYLSELCKTLMDRSAELAQMHSIYVRPLLIKISPDLTDSEIDDVLEVAINTGVSGIIATNTTTSHVEHFGATPGMGGVSGKPLSKRSTEVVRYISQKASGRLTLIAAGGIFSSEDALEKLDAGADLLQIYTGLVYEGPSLTSKINRGLLKSGRFSTASKLATKSG